ncbi:hypothetical protein J1N35_009578 [Gossypium stocksii]|uniref:Uncharacterized protein n=1 Tax=Gossypium stocksii TaxID=47602 RepID=A0A9D4ABT0_9ROSI|nr:hypothetical protein J1N35_009578 [Gossypium stocksii]
MPHYFIFTSLPLVLTFSANSKSIGYVYAEHTVLFIPGTNILGGLRAYWTSVWMVCGACSPFCELIGYMRTEIETFLRFLQAGSLALSRELDPQTRFVVLLWFALHSIS